jgi:outer membrane biosynthesis protein TonB
MEDNRTMKRLGWAVVVALALAASACASAQARSEPGGPALAPPAPPPHAIVPVEIAEEPAAPPAPPTPSDVLVKGSERSREPKPERPPEKPVEKPDPAAVTAQPVAPAPAPPLQTTKYVEEMERAIKARLDQAAQDLKRTNYRALPAERQAQYDTAQRFIHQAEEALKVKNLVFAEQLADKAATLAAALAPQK